MWEKGFTSHEWPFPYGWEGFLGPANYYNTMNISNVSSL